MPPPLFFAPRSPRRRREFMRRPHQPQIRHHIPPARPPRQHPPVQMLQDPLQLRPRPPHATRKTQLHRQHVAPVAQHLRRPPRRTPTSCFPDRHEPSAVARAARPAPRWPVTRLALFSTNIISPPENPRHPPLRHAPFDHAAARHPAISRPQTLAFAHQSRNRQGATASSPAFSIVPSPMRHARSPVQSP